MSKEPITAPSVVAEPVPVDPIPSLPDHIYILVRMMKRYSGEWVPSASEFTSPEGARDHWKSLRNFSARDTGPDAYIAKVELKADPKPETKFGATTSETGVLSIIAQYTKEHHALHSKLAELHAANAELRAKIDAMTTT